MDFIFQHDFGIALLAAQVVIDSSRQHDRRENVLSSSDRALWVWRLVGVGSLVFGLFLLRYNAISVLEGPERRFETVYGVTFILLGVALIMEQRWPRLAKRLGSLTRVVILRWGATILYLLLMR